MMDDTPTIQALLNDPVAFCRWAGWADSLTPRQENMLRAVAAEPDPHPYLRLVWTNPMMAD